MAFLEFKPGINYFVFSSVFRIGPAHSQYILCFSTVRSACREAVEMQTSHTSVSCIHNSHLVPLPVDVMIYVVVNHRFRGEAGAILN